MLLGGTITGGSYAIEREGPYPAPVFTFASPDLDAFRALVAHQVIHFDVRHDASGQLAYHLLLPDVAVEPAAIPVLPRDMLAVASGQGTRGGVTTRVVDARGESIALDDFTVAVVHDWNGYTARAWTAFERGRAGDPSGYADAIRVLRELMADLECRVTAAHHLLGRCLVAQGDLEGSLPAFREAIEKATRNGRHDPRLLPAAAAPLADLGLAYLAMRLHEPAVTCLEHALHLRPNHPAALLALATAASYDAPRVAHALARVAAIGGHEEALAACARRIAPHARADADELLAAARRDAATIDLGRWPDVRPELGNHEHLVERLDGPSSWDTGEVADVDPATGYRDPPAEALGAAEPSVDIGSRAAPRGDLPSDRGTAADVDAAVPARPWWKFWR